MKTVELCPLGVYPFTLENEQKLSKKYRQNLSLSGAPVMPKNVKPKVRDFEELFDLLHKPTPQPHLFFS